MNEKQIIELYQRAKFVAPRSVPMRISQKAYNAINEIKQKCFLSNNLIATVLIEYGIEQLTKQEMEKNNMLIKDKREKEETYLFTDIKLGCCFMHEGEPFIRTYQIFDNIDRGSSSDTGLATNLATGEVMRFDYSAEVEPVVIEAVIK